MQRKEWSMLKTNKFFLWVVIFWLAMMTFCTKKTNPVPGKDDPTTDTKPPTELPEPTRPPEKWALLIGIDIYEHAGSTGRLSNLAGCVNDVKDMENLLIGKFGFKKENIRILKNEAATHAAIVATFRNHLVENSQRDDIVVLHFSGHGSKMKDLSRDEPDGFDETIVPYDSRDASGKIFDLSDDEINGLLQELNKKTRNITFVFDACHSGTATRAAGRIRYAPPDTRTPVKTQPAFALSTRGVSEGANDLRREDLDYVLVSACLEKESAYEHYAEQKEHGALSYFLVRELSQAGAGVTYQDVLDQVGFKINSYYPNQHPQLEGSQRNNYVFSDSTSIARAYVLAHPIAGTKARLEAGQVHGMTQGSIFDVYPPGTAKFEPPVVPIAKIKLTQVSNFESEATLVSGSAMPSGSRAVEREHAYPDLKLRTYFLGLSASPTLRGIKNILADYSFIEFAEAQRNYHILLREQGNRIVMEGPDTTDLANPVAINNPQVKSIVVENVKNWAKWFNVLAIENRNTALKLDLGVNRVGETVQPGEALVVNHRERIQCTFKNSSDQDLYFVILDLSSDGGIAPIYPAEGASERIAARGSWSETIEVFVPEGMVQIKDVLKVFATSEPINVGIFTQAPMRKGERDMQALRDAQNPLEQLLSSAARGTTRTALLVRTGDWATTQTAFVVKR